MEQAIRKQSAISDDQELHVPGSMITGMNGEHTTCSGSVDLRSSSSWSRQNRSVTFRFKNPEKEKKRPRMFTTVLCKELTSVHDQVALVLRWQSHVCSDVESYQILKTYDDKHRSSSGK